MIYVLKYKKSLSSLPSNGKGGTITPKLFRQVTKDRNTDGEYEEDYRGRTIAKTRQFVTPLYSKRGWVWNSTPEKLTQLITKMRIRGTDGKIIEPGNVQDRLSDPNDPVFTHPDFYRTYFMTEGSMTLDDSDPRQAFILHCVAGSKMVDDRSEDGQGGPVSKFSAAGKRLELVSPGSEKKKEKKKVDRKIEAYSRLGAISNDLDKLRAVALIMKIPGFSLRNSDAEGIVSLLDTQVVGNTNTLKRFGNKSWQERFIELTELDTESLMFQAKVAEGIQRGYLRSRSKGFQLLGGKIIDVGSFDRLVDFFQDPDNAESLSALLSALDTENG